MSKFASLTERTPDAAFALIESYKTDPSPLKVDLSPGFYRDEDGRPWILPCVRKVALIIPALIVALLLNMYRPSFPC